MRNRVATTLLSGIVIVTLVVGRLDSAERADIPVTVVDYSGPAMLSVQAIGDHKLAVSLDPNLERNPLTFRVDLPTTGRETWPIQDVEVRNSKGEAVAVRRGGIEWHKLLVTVPPVPHVYTVQAVKLAGDRPMPPETQRRSHDPATLMSATICKWYDGREAALSLRFDDSHPTHLSKAIPILDEYGFRGTFMVNPGAEEPNSRRRSAFEDHEAEWVAVAQRGRHEFANHTLHHRGAGSDEEMDQQIGEASKAIWKLFPDKSKLTALNLGGGTWWTTTRTLRYYLDKYHLFDVSGSTGMDDVYGDRVATFRRLLDNHIERGLWYRVHYHYIGDGLSTSEENFRAALDIVKAHQDRLWIAGMADIHKYDSQRRAAALHMEPAGDRQVLVKLSCMTDAELYDQPLTIELTFPRGKPAEEFVVTDSESKVVKTRKFSTPAGHGLRFDVKPVTSVFTVRGP